MDKDKPYMLAREWANAAFEMGKRSERYEHDPDLWGNTHRELGAFCGELFKEGN